MKQYAVIICIGVGAIAIMAIIFGMDLLKLSISTQDYDIFRNVKFLERKFEESFKLEEARRVSEDLNLTEISRIMYSMMHPYITYQDQVISPWDICMMLQSYKIEFLGQIWKNN